MKCNVQEAINVLKAAYQAAIQPLEKKIKKLLEKETLSTAQEKALASFKEQISAMHKEINKLELQARSAKRLSEASMSKTAKVAGTVQPRSENTEKSSKKERLNEVSGFAGYVGGFENKGKGTPEGDGKDKAMREVADGFIGESVNSFNGQSLRYLKSESSTDTSFKEIGIKTSHNDFIEEGVTRVSGTDHTVVMLARNGKLGGKPLTDATKRNILESHNYGATFVVGDMPGVDSQFIDYLDEIGASYKIYHTGNTPRIKKEGATEITKDNKKVEEKTVENSSAYTIKWNTTAQAPTFADGKTSAKINTADELIAVANEYHKVLTKEAGLPWVDYNKHIQYFNELFKLFTSKGVEFKPFTLKLTKTVAKDPLVNFEKGTMKLGSVVQEAYPLKVVLHEYAYAITTEELNKSKVLKSRVRAIMDNVEKQMPAIKSMYAMTNEAEFIAEVISSPRLQHVLSTLKSDKQNKTIVDEIIQIFKTLVNRLTATEASALTDALDVVIELGVKPAALDKVSSAAQEQIIENTKDCSNGM